MNKCQNCKKEFQLVAYGRTKPPELINFCKCSVYIKDEGDFFSVWDAKTEKRHDIGIKHYGAFIKFLKKHKIPFESEIGMS